jgi:hypothetical protein
MSAVFENKTLGPTERLVMLALADHADDAGCCYPSMRRLCDRTGLGERAIQMNVQKLVKAGHLEMTAGGGRGNANLYRITLNPALDAPIETPQEMHLIPINPASRALNPAFNSLNPAPDAPEPLRTTIEPKKKKDAPDARAILAALGTVVSQGTAGAFMDHRKAKRSPLTAYAAELIAKRLANHPDPDAVLLTSIENGWTGVFPEKTQAKGSQGAKTDRRQFDAAINETARRLSDGTIHLDHSSRDPFAAR